MSYIVEVLRPIQKEEVAAVVREDSEMSVIAEGKNWIDFAWSRGEEHAVFNFAQGRISVTTPDEGAWEKAHVMAQRLGAAVIGEEDDLPNRPQTRSGVFAGRSTWIGWPILVVVLAALLAWKW
jgi:hypothetical protein